MTDTPRVERYVIWRCPEHPDDVVGTRTDEEADCSLCIPPRPAMERIEVIPTQPLSQLVSEWEKRARSWRDIQGGLAPGWAWKEAKGRASEIETCAHALRELLTKEP